MPSSFSYRSQVVTPSFFRRGNNFGRSVHTRTNSCGRGRAFGDPTESPRGCGSDSPKDDGEGQRAARIRQQVNQPFLPESNPAMSGCFVGYKPSPSGIFLDEKTFGYIFSTASMPRIKRPFLRIFPVAFASCKRN